MLLEELHVDAVSDAQPVDTLNIAWVRHRKAVEEKTGFELIGDSTWVPRI